MTLILSTCMIYANCACPKKKTSTKKSLIKKPKAALSVQQNTLAVPPEKSIVAEKIQTATVETNSSSPELKAPNALERDKSKEVVVDHKSHLMWQDNADAKSIKKNWESSAEYCHNLSLAQQQDWRLPTKDELLSIVDTKRSNPAIYSAFENVMSDYYWSSSNNINYNDFAWNVTFYFGIENNNYKDKNYYIRCVRDNK